MKSCSIHPNLTLVPTGQKILSRIFGIKNLDKNKNSTMFLSVKRYRTSNSRYRIELARKDQISEIKKLVQDNFHREETLAKSFKSRYDINEEELTLIEEDDDRIVAAVYENSVCLVAICNNTNKIVGTIMTLLNTRSSENQGDAGTMGQISSVQFKSEVSVEYYASLMEIDKNISILNKYPDAEAAMEIYLIAVSKEHRKRGLAKDLSLAAIEVATSMPYRTIVYGIYTSQYSKKIAKNIGMQHVMDLDLNTDFTDSYGQSIFPGASPNIISVMAMQVGLNNE